MNMDDLRTLCSDDTIVVTQHTAHRMAERGIGYSETKQAIITGEIIEDYPDDYPHPSCLILGNGLHVVAGVGDERLWIITVYRPSYEKWEADLKTRKAVEK